MSAKREEQGVVVTIGFAVAAGGAGVAYATLVRGDRGSRDVLRVPFAFPKRPGLADRDASYAAVSAVVAQLIARGEIVSSIVIADERLARDLDERRTLPHALTMPYVGLRCRLNRLRGAVVLAGAAGACRDLAARARADVFLDTAA